MFVAAYWSQRKEPKESAAERLAAFLRAIAGYGDEFETWYTKGNTRAAALRLPLDLNAPSIASQLTPNRRDADGQPIPDLGFQLAVWNGSRASLSATIGSWNQHVRNAVVLDIGDEDEYPEKTYRAIMEEMVEQFDPDHAVVTSDDHLRRTGSMAPWQSGLFTYARGGTVRRGRL